jgi:hypothetical protein
LTKHPTNFTREEYEAEQEQRRYYFARFCYAEKDRIHMCNDGEYRTWTNIFSMLEGINFWDYVRPLIEKKRAKKDTQSSQRNLWE